MKKLLLILSVVILSACGETPNYVEGGSIKSGSSQLELDINYFKDSRTGLCFSERGVATSYSHTCVPCSEEVEKLIK